LVKKSIIIPANPYIIYPHSRNNEPGDVEAHRSYLRNKGKVFWDVVPPGNVDTAWVHPDITTGYFYISMNQKVRYRFHIEKIGRLKEFGREFDDFVPPWRRSYWHEKRWGHDYGFLINEIEPLSRERELYEFTLDSTGKQVRRVQNYVIVVEQGFY